MKQMTTQGINAKHPEQFRLPHGLRLLGFILASLLYACAAPQQQRAPDIDKAPALTAPDLACAEIMPSEPLTIRYAVGAIYRQGAVLPTTEGLTCLDSLSAWLQRQGYPNWQVTVAGETDSGFDPEALADKRQELLGRFFNRKGIETAKWTWKTIASQEVQLQFTTSP